MPELTLTLPAPDAPVHYCTRDRKCMVGMVNAADSATPDRITIGLDYAGPGVVKVEDILYCAVKCPNSWHWADKCPDRQGQHLGAVEDDAEAGDGMMGGLGE